VLSTDRWRVTVGIGKTHETKVGGVLSQALNSFGI